MLLIRWLIFRTKIQGVSTSLADLKWLYLLIEVEFFDSDWCSVIKGHACLWFAKNFLRQKRFSAERTRTRALGAQKLISSHCTIVDIVMTTFNCNNYGRKICDFLWILQITYKQACLLITEHQFESKNSTSFKRYNHFKSAKLVETPCISSHVLDVASTRCKDINVLRDWARPLEIAWGHISLRQIDSSDPRFIVLRSKIRALGSKLAF